MHAFINARRFRLLPTLACALAMLVGGCSSSIDRALADVTRSGEGVQRDRHGDRFTFEDDPLPATALVGAVDPLPADFPADLYRPDAYRLLASNQMDGLRRVQLRADGTTTRLGEQARLAMLQRGWRPVMSRQHGDSQRVTAWVKDGRTAVLLFDRVALDEVRVAVQWRPAVAL